MVTETVVTGAPELAIDAIVHKHNVEPGAVIPVLQEIQETYGHVPPIAIQRVAEHLNIPASEIYGIVTFYAQFRLEPLGKNLVRVCHGTACHLGGAEMVAEALSQATGAREGETSEDGLFTVERVACLGCCSLAPCIMINDETHGRLTPESVSKVITEMRRAETSAPVA
ncbi:MAG: NADH-quinone oxidoreductase subunit NuoE [Dehalococcoidales bacterium]|nr:NADH-quinone oxidoreductase subunit NuoE [Dehalococcoidales bacterium]